jgi:hypothetical protein
MAIHAVDPLHDVLEVRFETPAGKGAFGAVDCYRVNGRVNEVKPLILLIGNILAKGTESRGYCKGIRGYPSMALITYFVLIGCRPAGIVHPDAA